MTNSKHKKPCPGGYENYNFGPALVPVIITIYSVCLIYTKEYRRRLSKKYINFTLFTQQSSRSLGECGGWVVHEIFNFSSIYLTDATYQIWLRLACTWVLENIADASQTYSMSDSGHLKTSCVHDYNLCMKLLDNIDFSIFQTSIHKPVHKLLRLMCWLQDLCLFCWHLENCH